MRQRPTQIARRRLRSATLSAGCTLLLNVAWAQDPAPSEEAPANPAPKEAPAEAAADETAGEAATDQAPATEKAEGESSDAAAAGEQKELTDAEKKDLEIKAENARKKRELEEAERALGPPPPPVTTLTLAELGKKSAQNNVATREQRLLEKQRKEEEDAAAAIAAEKARIAAMPDVDERAGYIPGYKSSHTLGLPPSSPRYQASPGGFTTPYHAAAPDDDWAFKFIGYASGSLRMSSGARENPTDDQSQTTLHTDPRIPDFYGAFQGTNATPGGWVDMHFQYGNATVESHVTLTTWKQGRAAAYTDVRSQNWMDQAYLLFRVPLVEDLDIDWTVGAFRNQYGGLGQYGAGQYNTIMIGNPAGVGETLALRYHINSEYTLTLEHGLMGRFAKIPFNSGPSPFNPANSPTKPSSWVNHAHLGIQRNGDIPLVFAVHYLSNWSQDERDQFDNPSTYWIDERSRPDGRLNIYGAEAKMLNNAWGDFAVAVTHATMRDIALLEGLGYFGAVSGEEITKRFLGQVGSGNGSMWAGGFEYNLSWAKLLYSPEPFWGGGPDLITSVFSNMASVKSEDPTQDGTKMLKFGSEVTYKFFPWLGVSGRYDHVIPNSKDNEETFDVISPKLLLKSSWITHEQVTVSYTRWFYGDHTHAEFPYEMPRSELDNQMFAVHFGMWW